MLLERIKLILLWLRRISYCRGFGIQSPSAYRFVRYVINEHYPYYAYDEFHKTHKGLSITEQKKMKFLFRLSNFAQSKHWFIYSDNTTYIENAIKTGCSKTSILDLEHLKEAAANDEKAVVLLDASKDNTALEELIAKLPLDSIIVMDNIYQTKANKMVWNRLSTIKGISVTFDLYHYGIAFIDKRIPTQYKINF